MFFLNNFDDGH